MAKTPPMIRVKPVPGRRVMLAHAPARVIDQERDVPWHSHYIRAIARGDLTRVTAKRATKKES